jgi:RNA polymerase sigma factor (sigma-70 family)
LRNNFLHNENELLHQIAEGDETAFKALYHFYYNELQPLLNKYAGSGVESEEIIQETFIRVWMNRDQLPSLDNFRAWLFTVASRVYLTALRTRINYDKRLEGFSTTLDPENKNLHTPFEFTHLQAIKNCIADAIHQLSPQRKKIYELSRTQGMSIEEIASELSLSKQTVKNVLQTSIRAIREYLNAAGYGFLLLLISFFKLF